jgi:hypothetical protein
MKKHLIIAIIIQFIFICSVFAQSEADIANQRLDKTLTLLQQRDQEIADLKKLVLKLEESKLTPCVVAINSFTEELQKLPMPDAGNSKIENKEIIKFRRDVRDIWKKSIQGQCGWQANESIWKSILKFATKTLILRIILGL